jgi:DNA gyrase/topoisomerase IV subunit A
MILETEQKTLNRDTKNSALINIDKNALIEHKIKKKMTFEICYLKNEINKLKEEIENIKEILSNKGFM